MGWIFRPQTVSDRGIDAEIEILDSDGDAIGRLIALQIKTGPSYLSEKTEAGFIFRGKNRHLAYWRRHSLPVVLVLHDPTANVSYWQSVEEWTNKSSGRGSLALKARTADGEERLVQDWPFVMFPGWPYEFVFRQLFPWADLSVDDEFYDDHDERAFDNECGVWDGEDRGRAAPGQGHEELRRVRHAGRKNLRRKQSIETVKKSLREELERTRTEKLRVNAKIEEL